MDTPPFRPPSPLQPLSPPPPGASGAPYTPPPRVPAPHDAPKPQPVSPPPRLAPLAIAALLVLPTLSLLLRWSGGSNTLLGSAAPPAAVQGLYRSMIEAAAAADAWEADHADGDGKEIDEDEATTATRDLLRMVRRRPVGGGVRAELCEAAAAQWRRGAGPLSPAEREGCADHWATSAAAPPFRAQALRCGRGGAMRCAVEVYGWPGEVVPEAVTKGSGRREGTCEGGGRCSAVARVEG